MTQVLKVTTNWTNFVGAPGYTNMYVRDFSVGDVDQAMLNGFVTKLDAFWDALVAYIPNNINVLIDPAVEAINVETGALEEFFTATPDAARSGTATGNYAGGSGAVINWYTDAVRNGRRLKGRSFLVPLAASAMDATGSLSTTCHTALQTASATLIDGTGAGDLGVWGRPTAPGATDGVWAVATARTVPDMAAVMRSRRS
jgi:hypothetical protein